jgi:hypothetical protein
MNFFRADEYNEFLWMLRTFISSTDLELFSVGYFHNLLLNPFYCPFFIEQNPFVIIPAHCNGYLQ